MPSFQIQVEQQTVLRQERDGTISLNNLIPEPKLETETSNIAAALQSQIDQAMSSRQEQDGTSETLDSWQTTVLVETEPELPAITVETPMIVEAIQSMLNPLDQPTVEPITANLRGCDITQDGNQLAIAQGGTVLLTADDGQVQIENAQPDLLQPLKELATAHAIVQGLVDGFDWVQQAGNATVPQPAPVPTEEVKTSSPQDTQPNTTETVKNLFDRLPGDNQDFWSRLAGDLEQAVKLAQTIDQASIRRNVVNATQQAASTVRQFVESEGFQQTQETVATKLQDELVWGTEKAGQGLEAAGK